MNGSNNNLSATVKKVPWGVILAVSAILVVALTAAVIGCWFVLNAIAGQTANTTTIFDTWWQTLIFIIDVIALPVLAASIYFFIKFRKEKNEEKNKREVKIPKILSKPLYAILSCIFAVLFIGFNVGESLTLNNASFINEFLGVEEYEIVQSEDGETFNEYVSDYVNDDGTLNDVKMRQNSTDVALRTATEGTVLLSNKNGALPLAQNSNVSFFGISSAQYLFSGAGSGHLGVSVTTNISEACKSVGVNVNPSLATAYRILSGNYGHWQTSLGMTLGGNNIGDKCYTEYGINEAPWNKLNSTEAGNVEQTFSQYGDAAILIISRNDGEDGDTDYKTSECVDNNYLDLAHEEINILNKLMELKQNNVFKKVILVINASSAMQMKHISQYDLDACVWVGIGGNVSFEQIAHVISGKANPSGRLIDTYVYENDSAPATVNQGDFTFATTTGLPATEQYTHNDKYIVYSEGIYVGYRYYETRYEDFVLKSGNAGNYDYANTVAYPFGYGQSYTTFQQSDFKVKEVKGGYEVSVTVKNTGAVAGKDVVQVYVQKPYTQYDRENGIEKASVELVGYAKTRELKAQESQNLTVFVERESFKSYDAYGQKTYIVEAGDYYLSAGLNSHDALNNILAKKGKTTADGMDYNGNADFAEKIVLTEADTTYSKSSATGYDITNQFDEADPTLYEGTKDQFADFKYLSRSDWQGTYPTPAVMDCVTQTMVDDLQYAQPVEEDPSATMPVFGEEGSVKLIDLWGREFDDEMWQSLLNQITWEEAVTLVTTGGGTAGCVSAGAPGALAKDGPGGINVGNANLSNVMCFPSQCIMAATFNDELIEELGNAFGMEILHVGYTGIYAPGANIHRSAYSGRNWEYYSEDPYISGKMLAAEVRGLQNRGAIVFTKHFALNDQERNRYGVSVWSNEQAIREIYLTAFEDGVTEGNMNGVMSSFNRIGAAWSGKHAGLLTEVLRNEWGFVGVVQTDAYVGVHMHRALAESVVAGNDFTMGGAYPAALDAYRDNATVAQALRDCAHRILYTQLHSNAMNGLKMDYKIVYHTPWWKTALTAGQIISGILAIVCILLLAISIIIPFLMRKKRKIEKEIEQTQGQAGVKVKYFFDVIPKNVTAITACCLAAIILISAIVPAIVNAVKEKNDPANHVCESICQVCGGCTDLECTSNACDEKCICNVDCAHACAVCGECLSADSTERECAEKCGDHYLGSQKFEAESEFVYKYGGAAGHLGIAQEAGAAEKYVGGYNANSGATIKYVLESYDSDITVGLVVSVCKRETPQLFANNVLVTVNGEILESKGVVPSRAEGELEWVTFTEVNLGCITLKEGRNVIEFTVINDDAACGFNFDGIRILSDSYFFFYSGEHICDDACPQCGLCTNDKCEDEVCLGKCICDVPKYEFKISDDKATVNGATQNADDIVFNRAGQSVVYNFKSLDKDYGVLYATVATSVENATANDLFTVKVNGQNAVVDATPLTPEYSLIKLNKVALNYGVNSVEIIANTNTEVNLSGVTVASMQAISYANPNEFLTISDYVTISGTAYKTNDNSVTMRDGSMGSIITFPVSSSANTSADLYFNLATRLSGANISSLMSVKVNGVEVPTSATVPNSGKELVDYSNVLIGNVSLKAGHNEVTIQVLTNDDNNNTDIRGVIFDKTDVTLAWSPEGKKYSRTTVEAESVTIVPVTDNGRSYPYVSEGFEASGNYFLGGVNDAALYVPGQAVLRIVINSSEASSAKFYFGIAVSGSAQASSFMVSVNSTEYPSNRTWTGADWYDWKTHYYGEIVLTAGENVIEIRLDKNETVNLDYFIIEATSAITVK